MTELEDKLQRYKGPSSTTEKDKQDRAERMVRNAVDAWASEQEVPVSYTVKGSYANNTNVRQDSDVDIAVVHGGIQYYDDSALRSSDKRVGAPISIAHFEGRNFRNNLAAYLKAHFGSEVDTTGSTAIELSENSSRVSADIVPSYSHITYYYDQLGNVVSYLGQVVYKTDGSTVINYPDQQLANGRTKNTATGTRYKQLVRILKRVENDLVSAGVMKALPSYFMECLVYRVPNLMFGSASSTPLTDDLQKVIARIFSAVNDGTASEWLEPNEIKSLFGGGQKWSTADARKLALESWSHLGLGD